MPYQLPEGFHSVSNNIDVSTLKLIKELNQCSGGPGEHNQSGNRKALRIRTV